MSVLLNLFTVNNYVRLILLQSDCGLTATTPCKTNNNYRRKMLGEINWEIAISRELQQKSVLAFISSVILSMKYFYVDK